MKHFLFQQSLSYGKQAIVITRCGVWKLVMVSNKGDADLLHLSKVN